MQEVDLKFWFGVRLALVSLTLPALGLSEGLAFVVFFPGAALIAVTGVVAVFRRLRQHGDGRAPAPMSLDFQLLDKRQSFTLHEISYYWEDRSLGVLPLDKRAKCVFDRFVRALMERRLDFRQSLDEIYDASDVDREPEREIRGDEAPFNVHSTIGRSELRRFAKQQRIRPMFLFYDSRAG